MIKKYHLICISVLFWCSGLLAQPFDLAEDIPFMENGTVLTNAMAGGMNAPIFSQGDLNFDGQDEMMVFDRSGNTWQVYQFIADGWFYDDALTATMPELDDWALVRDYDLDGVMDVFGGDTIGSVFGMQVYKGVRNGSVSSWELIELNQGDVNVIYYEVAGQNSRLLEILPSDLPAIDDVDFDGDLDILAFDVNGGFVEYIENQQVERGLPKDALIFERTDACWGKFFESGSADATISLSDNPNECFSEGVVEEEISIRHAGSTTTTLDYNRDGLIDALIGDIANDAVIYLRNAGTRDNAWMNFQTKDFPNNDNPLFIRTFPAVHIVDVDQDGLDDMLVTPSDPNSGENIEVAEFYETTSATGDWDSQLVQNDFLVETSIDHSQLSKPALADVDADGLLDIVMGVAGPYSLSGDNTSSLVYYRNNGSLENPSFEFVTDNYLDFRRVNEFNFTPYPSFGDLDGDNDVDMLLGFSNGKLIYYENTAGPGNPLAFATPIFDYQDIDVGNAVVACIFDLDFDGLADLIIGEENGNRPIGSPDRCSHLTFFKNIGSIGNPVFNSDEMADINRRCLGDVLTNVFPSSRGNSTPIIKSFGDKIYLFSGNREGRVMLFGGLEDGVDATYPLLDDAWGQVDIGIRSAVAIDDLNGDGLLELVVGNATGGLKIFYTNRSFDNLVALEDEKENDPLQLFPNPFDQNIMIQRRSAIDRMEVFTSEGRLIESIIRPTSNLSTGHWPEGLLLIRLHHAEEVTTQKMMKVSY